MKYAIVIEKSKNNYSAYVPNLLGCIATGKSYKELKQRMNEAIEMHVEGMSDDGLPVPKPSSEVNYVENERNNNSLSPYRTKRA